MTRSVLALLLAAPLTSALAAEPNEEAPPPAPGPRTYQLDASQSALAVLVKYDRGALVAGHDHIVQASTFTGTVVWDPSDPTACAIQIGFPVDALVVDPPGSRDRAGIEGTTPESDKAKIKSNLSGRSQLDAAKFPSIDFKSSSCTPKGDRFDVSGTLTMHGVGAPVTASMKITADEETFAASGSFTADHSAWSFKPFTAVMGALRNDPNLGFTIDVKGATE